MSYDVCHSSFIKEGSHEKSSPGYVRVTLDGVVEEPAWTTEFWSDELAKYQYDQLFASGPPARSGCQT